MLQENMELQGQARDEWWGVFEKIAGLLREAADICCEDGDMREQDREKYFISGRSPATSPGRQAEK